MAWQELTEEEKAVLECIKVHSATDKIRDPQIRRQVMIIDPDSKKPGAGLRRVINQLRQKGFGICSDTGGYWYASDRQELLENAQALRGRAIKIIEAAKGMENAAARFDEIQARLFEVRSTHERADN